MRRHGRVVPDPRRKGKIGVEGHSDSLVVRGPDCDHRVVLVDGDLRGLTEVGNLYVFQLDVEVFGRPFCFRYQFLRLLKGFRFFSIRTTRYLSSSLLFHLCLALLTSMSDFGFAL